MIKASDVLKVLKNAIKNPTGIEKIFDGPGPFNMIACGLIVGNIFNPVLHKYINSIVEYCKLYKEFHVSIVSILVTRFHDIENCNYLNGREISAKLWIMFLMIIKVTDVVPIPYVSTFSRYVLSIRMSLEKNVSITSYDPHKLVIY